MNAMEKKKANVTRKNGRHLRVPVLPNEEAIIKEKAAGSSLSTAAYLRNVGMGYPIKSKRSIWHTGLIELCGGGFALSALR